MDKFKKRIIIGLIVLAVLSPLGIIIPRLFHAGDAWGEWSPEKVKEKAGYTPEKMKKDAGLYKAPLPDYGDGTEKKSVWSESVLYLISGFVGIGIIGLSTFVLLKIYRKHE